MLKQQARTIEVEENNEVSDTFKPCIALYYSTIHVFQMWPTSHLHDDHSNCANAIAITPVWGQKKGKRPE